MRALPALLQVDHPDIGTLALRFLKQRRHICEAADLLVGRVEPGDEVLLRTVMSELEAAERYRELHRLVSTFVDLAGAQLAAEQLGLLADSDVPPPCSLCRADLVRLL
ncbi:hypothetical protein [Deinococcus hopiensis]|uniref:Uncharacterized protein n=1 Tax=Deinococcus hopiensis KR-140 TaxID=695939 RepID=A0A1W1UK03_9DEIO|nr:hypothetical protein [Deinococcus hopiensis]SMB81397.1 hypothetical protein SAMN00790413_04565 [Deinococcus hopiensis KR-140]